MNKFIVLYFSSLIASSSALAYFKQRTAFLLLFSFTMVSLLIGILWGESGLRLVGMFTAVMAAASGVGYCFREFLGYLVPGELGKIFATAPLTASFGLFIILVYLIAAIFAPVIAPFGEAEIIADAFAPADKLMILGGDQLGRDMFSRIIYGARNTVGLSLIITSLAFIMGTFLGLFAALKGGWIDQLLGRAVDIVMSIPALIFSLLLLSIFGTNSLSLILVIAIIYTPVVFRLARSVAGNIIVMDYVEAARLRGEGSWYLMWREILPNASAPLIAEFGLRFCFVFLLIAGLSFLGLGIQPPTADWGSMVRDNASLITFGEYTPLIPAAAIALLTLSINFVVDWMLYRSSGLKD
ncbi:MAG: peptide/nickel transport system permease protein [Desulforhopalus sp.]|jgi:peptide/nickel transport system permease protein